MRKRNVGGLLGNSRQRGPAAARDQLMLGVCGARSFSRNNNIRPSSSNSRASAREASDAAHSGGPGVTLVDVVYKCSGLLCLDV